MSIPIWFLDIDGVVNAISDAIPPGYRRTTALTMGRGWRIVYSPDVVDFINFAHRQRLAEVRWLTTWEQDAHRELAPTVGLDAFPAYDIPDADSPSGWWKADVVALSVAEEKRPIIWTDDDLGQEDVNFLDGSSDVESRGLHRSTHRALRRRSRTHPGLHWARQARRLPVAPESHTGLMAVQMPPGSSRGSIDLTDEHPWRIMYKPWLGTVTSGESQRIEATTRLCYRRAIDPSIRLPFLGSEVGSKR